MSDIWGPSGQLVGRWDPDARLYIATGWTYGPAGPAAVDLSPTVRLSVDYANPHVTSELIVEAPLEGDPRRLDDETLRVAQAFLGRPTLRRLIDLALSGAAAHPIRISDEYDFGDPKQGLRHEALGRFALLVETATDPALPKLQAALAGLEAAVVASMADPGMDVLLPVARALAEEAGEALLDLAAAGSLGLDDLRVERDLAAAIRHVSPLLDEVLARRLRRVSADLREGKFRLDAPVAAMADFSTLADAFSAPGGQNLVVDGPLEATAFQVTPNEIDVYGGEAGDDHWARVFRRDDELLLALAPLRSRPDGRRALLVIPSGFQPDELLVDITHEPDAPRPSPALVIVRAAVAAGREACRFERLRDQDTASRRWVESFEAWRAVGDDTRADTARSYSRGDRSETASRRSRGGQSLPQPPFLADRAG